ncbi:hypothetical protein B0H12DRAFT_1239621 [Mycena haematopus]|nr:hypothetical protein B0H12DRAFT_1239621 [Mycena haematopus]
MLRLHGFILALVVAMHTVLEACKSDPNSRQFNDNFEWSFGVTLELLEYLLNSSLEYRWLPAAIGAGLLGMMAGIATEFPSMFDTRLGFLLRKILSGLLYFHVVAAIEEAVDEGTEMWYSGALKDTEIAKDWDSFLDLAEKRAQLLESLQSRKACDNLECGKIQDSSHCRRCSGCNIHYYCSSDCQIADWKHGGHRDHCGSPTVLSLGETSSCPLGYHERSFLRALVQEGYTDAISTICQMQVLCMAEQPGGVFTFFDYVHDPKAGSEWTEILSRVSRSGGRIQLHVIRIPMGNHTRLFVVPLRTNSPQVHDALHQLAQSLPTGSREAVSDEVNRILEHAVDLVEIH